jgi:hypothetical protein
MPSSGMLRSVARVKTDVSEERNAYIIKVTRIGELGTTLAVRSVSHVLGTVNVVPSSPILVTLMMKVPCSSETSVLTRVTPPRKPQILT